MLPMFMSQSKVSSILFDGSSQHVYIRPSCQHPSLKRGASNIQFDSPLGQGLGFAVQRKQDVATNVITLLALCSPFAVRCPVILGTFLTFATRIMSQVINAFNRVTPFGTFAHISKPITKRYIPSLANTNATGTVLIKIFMLTAITSVSHILPRAIQRMVANTVTTFFLWGRMNIRHIASSLGNLFRLGEVFNPSLRVIPILAQRPLIIEV